MGYDYDKLYGAQPDALGAPTQIFVDHFERLPGKALRVLDVGCGQGRDALFIARLGHHVLGVDLSANGIRDLNAAAKREGLSVEGVVANICTFEPDSCFDILLLDRTLHMLPAHEHLMVLEKLLGAVTTGGQVLIADEARNIPGMKQCVLQHVGGWEIVLERGGYLFAQREL